MIHDVIHEEQMENEEDMKTRGSILQNTSPDQMKHNSSNMIRRESEDRERFDQQLPSTGHDYEPPTTGNMIQVDIMKQGHPIDQGR